MRWRATSIHDSATYVSLRPGTSHKLMRCLVVDVRAKRVKCHMLASLLNSPMMVDCEQIGGLRKVIQVQRLHSYCRIALDYFAVL